MKSPYPGLNPNIKAVNKTGGLIRNCVVVELLSDGELNNIELAMVQEAFESAADSLTNRLPIKKFDIVLQNRFDNILMDGLRLTK